LSSAAKSGVDLPNIKKRLGPSKTTTGNNNGTHDGSVLYDCYELNQDE